MRYEEMVCNIENGNRKEVVEAIRALPSLDAFLCAVALKEALEPSVFQGFWELIRIST
jgi:hypothetical protein